MGFSDSELETLFDVPFRFWTCPKGCRGMVRWSGEVATCEACGFTSDRARAELQAASPGDRLLVLRDNGDIEEHAVKWSPRRLPSGEWVVWLEGMAGCYALARCRKVY